MSNAFLTLNLPTEGLAAGTPVVAFHNPCLLAFFKRNVLIDWQRRVESASDGILAQVGRLEFDKLRLTLDLLIPDDTSPDDSPGFEEKTVFAEHQFQVSYKMNVRIIRNKIPMMLRMLREVLEDPEYREKE